MELTKAQASAITRLEALPGATPVTATVEETTVKYVAAGTERVTHEVTIRGGYELRRKRLECGHFADHDDVKFWGSVKLTWRNGRYVEVGRDGRNSLGYRLNRLESQAARALPFSTAAS